MSNKAYEPFVDGEVLHADRLNKGFGFLRGYAERTAAMPGEMGVFRPVWLADPDALVNWFSYDNEDALVIENLALALPSGTCIFIERERIERFPRYHIAYVAADGVVRTARSADLPANAFRLARSVGKTKHTLEYPIAEIDADDGLRVLDGATRKAAVLWRDALEEGGSVYDPALADGFDDVASSAHRALSSRLGDLARLARRLERRMTSKAMRDKRIADLHNPPEDTYRITVETWLEDWLAVFRDEALFKSFFHAEGWRMPGRYRPGRIASGLSEALFDLADLDCEEVELAAPGSLANGRWRYGEAGRENPFPNGVQVGDGWRVRIPREGGSLYIWADVSEIHALRVRPIDPDFQKASK